MITFDQRLKRILRDGNLRVADLGRWYDRRHSTVSGWLAGSAVTGAPLDVEQVYKQTDALEAAIKARELPLPKMPAARRLKFLARLKRRC